MSKGKRSWVPLKTTRSRRCTSNSGTSSKTSLPSKKPSMLSLVLYMPRAMEQIPMVFFQSCEQGFLQYLHWAIHNSSVWLNNECFRAIAIAILSLPEEILHHRSPADSLHVLLGDEFGPNFWYTHPSFSCSISPWTRFLFYFIAKAASNSLCVFEESTIWSIISTFIENNAMRQASA